MKLGTIIEQQGLINKLAVSPNWTGVILQVAPDPKCEDFFLMAVKTKKNHRKVRVKKESDKCGRLVSPEGKIEIHTKLTECGAYMIRTIDHAFYRLGLFRRNNKDFEKYDFIIASDWRYALDGEMSLRMMMDRCIKMGGSVEELSKVAPFCNTVEDNRSVDWKKGYDWA